MKRSVMGVILEKIDAFCYMYELKGDVDLNLLSLDDNPNPKLAGEILEVHIEENYVIEFNLCGDIKRVLHISTGTEEWEQDVTEETKDKVDFLFRCQLAVSAGKSDILFGPSNQKE